MLKNISYQLKSNNSIIFQPLILPFVTTNLFQSEPIIWANNIYK